MNKHSRQIVKSYYRKLKKQLKQLSPEFDAEVIHNWRVTYKKLRAMLRMLSVKEKLKLSKKIIAYYRQCGTLRDLQLQQQRIKKAAKHLHQKPAEYLLLLKAEIKKISQQLTETISPAPLDNNRQKNNEKMPRSFSQTAFRNYLSQKWQDARKLTASGIMDKKQLHAVRKILKDIFYNLAAMQKHGYKNIPVFAKVSNRKHLNKLLGKMGNFQDHAVAIDLLNSAMLKKTSIRERKLLTKIRTQWIKEHDLLKQALISELKKELNIA